MKLINLLLFLFPVVGFSQVDTSYLNGDVKMTMADTSNMVTRGIKIVGDTVFYDYARSSQMYYLANRRVNKDSAYRLDGEHLYVKPRTKPKLYKLQPDTFPDYRSITTTPHRIPYYGESSWLHTTELVKGKVETPINVIDSGMKVEVVETRDTIYKCPYSNNITFFTTTVTDDGRKLLGCTVDKIVTNRRYKLYIINEYGQKEYLSMELTKQK
jgi:hypothetical protein